jgi:GntR family transcriptional repressor for pyruvate dehydrogenase complex
MRARKSVEVELRRLIATGRYAPGDRLPSERALAEEFGISRNIVREAVRGLLEIGVFESRSRSGLYLADIDLQQLFDVRLLLEPGCARSAAANHDAVDAIRMNSVLERLFEAGDDMSAVAEVDAELHLAIAQATRNAVLYRVMLGLHELAAFSRAITVRGYVAEHSVAEDMSAVVEQILRRRPDEAAEAMLRHLNIAQAAAPPRRSGEAARSRRGTHRSA